MFSLARVIGRDRNDRISTAFPSFVRPFLSDGRLISRRTRIRSPASLPCGLCVLYSLPVRPLPGLSSTPRLRNTIKLFLATTRSLPCAASERALETEVKGFRRFRVVIYFRPRGPSGVCGESHDKGKLSSRVSSMCRPWVLDFSPFAEPELPPHRSVRPPPSFPGGFHPPFLTLLSPSFPRGIFPSFFPRERDELRLATLSPRIRAKKSQPPARRGAAGCIKILVRERCNFADEGGGLSAENKFLAVTGKFDYFAPLVESR